MLQMSKKLGKRSQNKKKYCKICINMEKMFLKIKRDAQRRRFRPNNIRAVAYLSIGVNGSFYKNSPKCVSI